MEMKTNLKKKTDQVKKKKKQHTSRVSVRFLLCAFFFDLFIEIAMTLNL